MTRTRKIIYILFSVCLVIIINACADESGKETALSNDKIQIGFSLDSKVAERWKREIDVFTFIAHKRGAEVEVKIANGSVMTQVEQIDQFIQEKKDAIVIVPSDCQSLNKVIERAKRNKIKVICYDRLVSNSAVDLFVSFDYEKIGKIVAEGMVQNLSEASEVIMIEGSTHDNNNEKMHVGFKKVINESTLKVKKVYKKDNDELYFKVNAINDGLSQFPNIKGIMCGDDEIALQVMRTLAENKLGGKILVTGQNCDIGACQKCIDGQMFMTVYKDFDELAKTAAELTVMLVQKMDIGENIVTQNGEYSVPTILLEPVGVTKDNMKEQVIDTGLHVEEDIYLED